jgi:hypothetical protein
MRTKGDISVVASLVIPGIHNRESIGKSVIPDVFNRESIFPPPSFLRLLAGISQMVIPDIRHRKSIFHDVIPACFLAGTYSNRHFHQLLVESIFFFSKFQILARSIK